MYNSNDVADRIRLLVKDKNMSMKQLLIDVDLGKNTMSNFKTSMPKADNLAKIADYLDCSVDYLLGRTDNPEINRTASQSEPPKRIPFANRRTQPQLAAYGHEVTTLDET